jgi:hypothetical protein
MIRLHRGVLSGAAEPSQPPVWKVLLIQAARAFREACAIATMAKNDLK